MEQGTPIQAKLNLGRLETIVRYLRYAAVLTLVVFVFLIAVSWWQWRQINEDISDAQSDLIEKKAELNKLQGKIDDLQVKADNLKRLNVGLSNATRVASEDNPGQYEKIQNSIEDSISQSTNPRQIPPRIYLQIGSEEQRKRAGEVARQLEASGYIVPGLKQRKGEGVELVPRAPRVSQLRFSQTDDLSAADVKEIMNVLQKLGLQVKPVQLPSSAKARPRHYELWFGDDF